MSSTTDAYFSMHALEAAVDQQIANDIIDKVSRAIIELQIEADEWKSKAIAAKMHLDSLNEIIVKRDRRDELVKVALEEGKNALDELMNMQFPKEFRNVEVFYTPLTPTRIDTAVRVAYISKVLQKIRTAQNAFITE